MRAWVAVFLAGGVLAAGPSFAAPQMLGIVTANKAIPLQCNGGICEAEISTICLQEDRQTPPRHHPYAAVDLAAFKLVAKSPAGDTVHVDLHEAAFRSERGYTAVSAKITTDHLRERGLTPVALVASAEAAFLPVPEIDDPDPINAAEIDFVMRDLNPAAKRVFADHQVAQTSITLVNRLVNGTPKRGRMTHEQRTSLWERTMGETPREAVGGGAARAADIYGYCQYRTKQGRFFSLRRCLEQRLDGFLMDLNTTYWQSVKPGS